MQPRHAAYELGLPSSHTRAIAVLVAVLVSPVAVVAVAAVTGLEPGPKSMRVQAFVASVA